VECGGISDADKNYHYGGGCALCARILRCGAGQDSGSFNALDNEDFDEAVSENSVPGFERLVRPPAA
jgi:hypothetical protein